MRSKPRPCAVSVSRSRTSEIGLGRDPPGSQTPAVTESDTRPSKNSRRDGARGITRWSRESRRRLNVSSRADRPARPCRAIRRRACQPCREEVAIAPQMHPHRPAERLTCAFQPRAGAMCREVAVGDPGLEPGTSSLSELRRSNGQSSPVVKDAANRLFLGGVSRPETTVRADRVHPKGTPDGPPSVRSPFAGVKAFSPRRGALARVLRPSPAGCLCKAVLRKSPGCPPAAAARPA